MEHGVVFPQTEIGPDPIVVRDYVQAAEEIGYGHLVIYDHVLGADPDRPGGWHGRPYDKDSLFHEPLVLFGYLAGLTERIELVTGILILPQRQTALVAKQAAEVDILSRGRLRLGVGTGWNEVEYEALGENFHDRGKRQEEQIALLRELWANETVSFDGKWHTVTQAGLNPRPGRRIPVWFGGGADAVIERAARIGDGWFPIFGPDDRARAALDTLRGHLEQNGRDPASFGIQTQSFAARGNPDDWRKQVERWRELGATHVALSTMSAGLAKPDDHLRVLREYWDAVSG